MATVKPQYLAFNAGEMDAYSLARADLENYPRGAEVLSNIFPYIQGRMEKAPGTRFVSETPDSAAAVLRPFVFNENIQFALEMTENKIRIISGTGYVQAGSGGASTTLGASWADDSTTLSAGGGTPPSVGGDNDGGGGDLYDYDIGGAGEFVIGPGGQYP